MIMIKEDIIKAIKQSNIPTSQKQEILQAIQHKTNPGQIAQIIIDALNLGINFLSKFPP